MASPKQKYLQKIKANDLDADNLQASIVDHFDCLYQQITAKKTWFKKTKHAKGIYLWGPVGRGKTMIIDLFLGSLPENIPFKRYHYHAFMRMIHQELRAIQGTKYPLQVIAKKLKQEVKLLFLDEFFVMDMANAMILGDLLQALFKEEFILLTTSNCAPDALYQNGMFRERFLPAIAAIQKNMQVLSLCCEKDYRIKQQLENNRCLLTESPETKQLLEDIFHHLTQNTIINHSPIIILDRAINIIARNESVIWFNFDAICSVPRSQNDYLVLADQYDTFIISDIPIFTEKNADAGLYFTMLIDVLYDEHKYIIMSTTAPLEDTFPQQGPLALGFERTYSRLIEMQTPEYNHSNN